MFRGRAVFRNGHRAHVKFGDDAEWWHQRVFLRRKGGDRYVVLTPHGDIYVESRADYAEEADCGPRGRVPYALTHEQIVRFDEEHLRDHRQRFEAEAERVHGAASEHDSDREDQSRPDDGWALVDAAVPPPAVTGAPSDSHTWVAIEQRCGYNVGDPIPLQNSAVITRTFLPPGSDRGIVAVRGHDFLSVGHVGTLVPASVPAAADDLRTLPVKYLPGGERARVFSNAVGLCTESEFPDWAVEGPRTLKWLCNTAVKADLTFKRRHTWWKQSLGLSANDAGVEEHDMLSEVMEVGLAYDQLNVSNLLSFEILARRYQLWEEHYGELLKTRSAGSAGPTSVDMDERGLFAGRTFSAAHAWVCPALHSWIADRVRDKAAVLKERRKAREERTLAAGSRASDAAGGGDDDGKGSRAERRAKAKGKAAGKPDA